MDNRDIFCIMGTGQCTNNFSMHYSFFVTLIYGTGVGKSLTYQLPALLKGGCTIVLEPRLSIIQDQVDKLKGLGCKYHSKGWF